MKNVNLIQSFLWLWVKVYESHSPKNDQKSTTNYRKSNMVEILDGKLINTGGHLLASM